MKRLGQVIVRTGIEPGHAVRHRIARGQQDHRRGVARSAQPAQHVDAAAIWQHDVEQDTVVAVVRYFQARFMEGACRFHYISLFCQCFLHQFPERRFVFNY